MVLTSRPGFVCADGDWAEADGSGALGDLGDAGSEVVRGRLRCVCDAGTCSEPDGSGEQGDLGDPCSEVLTCRPELVCAGGKCSKVQEAGLPTTGIGSTAGRNGNGGSGWLIPAALAGAAAFVVNRLRGTTEGKETAD